MPKQCGPRSCSGMNLIVFLVILILLTTGCMDEGDDEKETEGWKNLSDIQNDIQHSLPYKFRYLSNTTNARNIQDPGKTMIFLIGLETSILPGESDSLLEYVEKGGTLVFASEKPDLAEPFTRTMGIRYYRHDLLDGRFYYNWAFIISTSDLYETEYDVMFNAPRGLNLTANSGNNTDVEIDRLFASSPITIKDMRIATHSFIDLNDNGEHDTWDQDGPIAMAYRVKWGKGTAYIFGNSGLFIDDFISKRDNTDFVHRVISDSIPNDGFVYFDVTHQVSARSDHLGYSEG